VSSEQVADDSVLYDVALDRYPLRLGARASEHYEAVFREFALLAASEDAEAGSVPERMLALVDALGRRYARNSDHEQQREEALARGESSIDLVLRVPASVSEFSQSLDRMLDETDDFCRDGTLLTLEAPEDVVAFRRWYLGELVAQLAGRPASPWPGEPR
jgi:hypothetical protein